MSGCEGAGARSVGAGLLIVISGPSGVGKDTIVKRMLAADANLRYSVSHTTRARREYEVQGRHYNFVGEDEFRRFAAAGELLESAEYNGHLYGTSRRPVEAAQSQGRDIILKIEVQGAELVRRRRPDGVFIFIAPPSMAELVERRARRGTDSEEEMAARQSLAEWEMTFADRYDHVVVNEDAGRAAAEILDLIRRERVRRPGVRA
ncbi:MAG: guanylate kinase [Candidatus Dormibacteraceae bacterium]